MVKDAVVTPVVDVLVIMQLEFQQSCQFVILKVPQIQFIDRLSANCAAKRRDSTGAGFPGRRRCDHAATGSSGSLEQLEGAQNSLSTELHDDIEAVLSCFMPHFAAFFGLRPFGRRVPALCGHLGGALVEGSEVAGTPGFRPRPPQPPHRARRFKRTHSSGDRSARVVRLCML